MSSTDTTEAEKPVVLAPLSDENRAEYSKARAEEYQAASTTLREKYREEYNALVKAGMAERGYDWSPRSTADRDKTLEKIKALAAKAGLGVDEVAAALVPSTASDDE